MDDESRLLSAIQSQPGDRDYRLAYADWLEERGDSRAAVIRLEEQMRMLPAYSERYWRLKPKRNALRAACDGEWLAALRYGTDYEPVFHEVPSGWKARWRLLREFIERWQNIPLADVDAQIPAIRAAERSLRARLSPAIAEWIAFCEELLAKSVYDHVIRDCYSIERLPDLGVVSLMIAGESDFHWAVKENDIESDDPAVDWFSNVETSAPDRFEYVEQIAPHVTGFVFKYLDMYLEMGSSSRGFTSRKPATPELLDALTNSFPVHSVFDGIQVFEARNILVTSGHSHGGDQVRVHTRTRMTIRELPECLHESAREARWI